MEVLGYTAATLWCNLYWKCLDKLLHHFGSVGHVVRAVDRRTALGQAYVEVFRHNATLFWGNRHCDYHSALPRYLAVVGIVALAVFRHITLGQWAVEPLKYSAASLRVVGIGLLAVRGRFAWGQ